MHPLPLGQLLGEPLKDLLLDKGVPLGQREAEDLADHHVLEARLFQERVHHAFS